MEGEGETETSALLALIQPYEFQPLDPRRPQTRMLTLEAGLEGDVLIGTLSPCFVGHRMPQYKAISYCWGDVVVRDYEILLDGRVLAITRNAYHALVNCRYPDRRKMFWMDQVCINQEDVEERSRHIPYMAYIYGQAGSVIAYLGEGSEGFDELFGLMHALGNNPTQRDSWWFLRSQTKPLGMESPLSSLFGPSAVLSYRKTSRLKKFEDQVEIIRSAFDLLLTSPWFRRIWVIQEATLPTKLFIRCGKRSVNWEALNFLNLGFHYMHSSEPVELDTALGYKSIAAMALLRNFRPGRRMALKTVADRFRWRMKFSPERSFLQIVGEFWRNLTRTYHPPLLLLLRQFRHQLATDERDKVFGLLGLASFEEVQGYLGVDGVDADYTSNIVSLCYNFAVWHILHTGTLDILMAACYGARMHASLPFWVPDWSQEASMCETMYAFEPYMLPPHRAGRQRSANPQFIPSCMAMILEGFDIDVVVSVVDQSVDVYTYNQPSAAVWRRWKEFALVAPDDDPYEPPAGRYNAYWRTIVYDVDSGGSRAGPALGELFTAWADGQIDPQSAEITGRFVFQRRKLFRTKRGFLGNGCGAVEVGDKVCVCFGGRLPLLLRESKLVSGRTTDGGVLDWEEKTFVGHLLVGGDCYVHGLGDGQAFTIAEREGLRTEQFCLI